MLPNPEGKPVATVIGRDLPLGKRGRRMFRKLILATAVSLALVPGTSAALGLGGIRSQTALNDLFVGEIDLFDVEPDELDTVKVVLAPAEDFSKAGADRHHFLTQLRFKPQVSPQGRTIIRATSPEPVREPFLDFLIQVTWPKGRLVKEYTVLLDPPVTTNRLPPPIERAAVSRRSSASVRSSLQATAPPIPSPQAAGVPEGVDTSAFPLRYGPIKSGEGLWRIARRLAPSGATVAQTAMALYRNNQRAFIRGDINKVKLGARLEIPTAAELYALDAKGAEREFKAALSGGRVTAAPITDVAAAVVSEDQLKIAAAAAPEAGTQATTLPREAGEIEPELGVIQTDLILVQEAGESTRQETQELRGRVLELETQLEDIRRLLQLRNEQLAQLQGMEMVETVDSDAETAEAPLPEEISAESEMLAPPPEYAAPAVDAEPARTDGGEAVGLSNELAAVAQKPAATSAPQAREEPERSVWETATSYPWSLALATPLLLLLLGWLILHRRKRLEEALQLSAFDEEIDLQKAVSGSSVATLATAETTGHSDASEGSGQMRAPYTGFGNLGDETEEADVISEADVYIAYGRYREAQSLLEEEIANSPGRLDLKYKLAEAHFGARNLPALTGLMEKIRNSGSDQANPEQWQQLTSMVHELEGGRADSGDVHKSVVAPQQPEPEYRVPPVVDDTGSWGIDSELDFSLPLSEEAPESYDVPEALELALGTDAPDLAATSLDVPNQIGEQEKEARRAELELSLEDLDTLGGPDLDESMNSERKPFERALKSVIGPDRGGQAMDSLDIAPIGKDSIDSDMLSSQWNMDSGVWDEVVTKIDLARAYMEMEDSDAARVILEEVAEEGNEDQRAEAKEMLERLP